MTDYSDEYDNFFDEEVKGALEDLENGKVTFDNVPDGEYSAKIDRIELKNTSTGKKMVSAWWKIQGGENDGRFVFSNYVLGGSTPKGRAFSVFRVKKFFESLKCFEKVTITSMEAIADYCVNADESISGKYQYVIKVSTDKNGFTNVEVIDGPSQ